MVDIQYMSRWNSNHEDLIYLMYLGLSSFHKIILYILVFIALMDKIELRYGI